jgi:hypothetical protein
MLLLHVHSSLFTVLENPCVPRGSGRQNVRELDIMVVDVASAAVAASCCQNVNLQPPVIVHHQKKQTRCLRRRCRLNHPPHQPHFRPRRH